MPKKATKPEKPLLTIRDIRRKHCSQPRGPHGHFISKREKRETKLLWIYLTVIFGGANFITLISYFHTHTPLWAYQLHDVIKSWAGVD